MTAPNNVSVRVPYRDYGILGMELASSDDTLASTGHSTAPLDDWPGNSQVVPTSVGGIATAHDNEGAHSFTH